MPPVTFVPLDGLVKFADGCFPRSYEVASLGAKRELRLPKVVTTDARQVKLEAYDKLECH